MSIPDTAMLTWYKLLTSRTTEEIEAIEQGLGDGSLHPRDQKVALGRELVARFHDEQAAAAAEQHFNELFRDKKLTVDAVLVECQLEPDDNETGFVYLPKLLERWFGLTRGEARRRIRQGGVSVADRQVLSEKIGYDGLVGATIKVGKSTKFHGVIRVVD